MYSQNREIVRNTWKSFGRSTRESRSKHKVQTRPDRKLKISQDRFDVRRSERKVLLY